MERFSMNEFKPLSLLEKQSQIKNKIADIATKRQPLITRKQEIELELSTHLRRIKTETLDNDEYRDICKSQNTLGREKLEIERKLSSLKEDGRKLQEDEHRIFIDLKRIPDGKAKQTMLEIRDKYMSFAADTTRVSSMRAMASRFVEEIQLILTDMQ